MLLTVEGGSIGDGVREIDLAGNTVYQITRPDINKAVAAADIPFQLETLHHDVEKLANRHYILGNYTQTISGQSEVGDALVDWDPSAQKAAWTWSAFDHLSLNRAQYGIAFIRHANSFHVAIFPVRFADHPARGGPVFLSVGAPQSQAQTVD